MCFPKRLLSWSWFLWHKNPNSWPGSWTPGHPKGWSAAGQKGNSEWEDPLNGGFNGKIMGLLSLKNGYIYIYTYTHTMVDVHCQVWLREGIPIICRIPHFPSSEPKTPYRSVPSYIEWRERLSSCVQSSGLKPEWNAVQLWRAHAFSPISREEMVLQ